MNPHRLKAYLLLFIVTVIWAFAGPIIKYTLGGIPPLLFLTYRFGLSTLISVICFFIFGFHLPKEGKLRCELILYGFLTSTVSLGLLFFGLKETTVLDMSLITLINPLLVTLAGVYFLKEHVTGREKIGMAVALIGTILIVLEPFFQNGHSLTRFSGNFLILLYLLSTAWDTVLAKKLLRAGVNPLTITGFSFIVGFITLFPFALITYPPGIIRDIPISYHLGVIYMAVLSGSLAYYLSNKAQKTVEIGEAAVFSYLYPLFSTPLAVIWLGEKITSMFIFGALIISLGVAIAEIKKKRYNTSS
jgi:drug/metabolite transporter (DMT)-like permease